ncbi:glycosyltransferase family 8 protein [Yoonia litorea]|uniref:Glycosyl transferase family 8 n=1 Tax=Yoonia litorea TaxID=1123755 RepID=A0A1I6MUZ1_9RHOB|nr:glycosyltransferase [Yoonia litorea]SFS19533.1 Glycosyl transferase family 8 [Yoonia litorea]
MMKPKKQLAVCLCSDANMIWQSLFALGRLIALNDGPDVHFFLFHSASFDERYRSAVPQGVTLIKQSAPVDGNRSEPGLPTLTSGHFLRLAALEQLSEEFERVVYFDSDIFARWGSVAHLSLIEMADRPLAAVRDVSLWQGKPIGKHRDYHRSLPAKVRGNYFNSGMLLVNSDAFRLEEIGRRAATYWTENPETCRFGDQSALNRVVDGNWIELSPSWNWQAILPYQPLIASRNPRIVHFIGRNKPWVDPLAHQEEIYWYKMQLFLRENSLHDEIDAHRRGFRQPVEERKRFRVLRDLAGDVFETRKRLQHYFDRDDFADISAGLQTYRTDDLTMDC